jgi:hypothetical protein
MTESHHVSVSDHATVTEEATVTRAEPPPQKLEIGTPTKQYTSVPDNLVYTTTEVVRVAVIEELDVRDAAVERAWQRRLDAIDAKSRFLAAIAFLVPMVVTLVTVDFERRGVSAETWQAIFIVLAVISLVVALWSGPRWLFLLYRQRPADAASKQDFAETIVQRLTQRHL